MANISGAVQIETGIKHRLSIPVQSVAVEQSIDVGTLLHSHQYSLQIKQRRYAGQMSRPDSSRVNTPPAKAGGFRLRLKAGLVRPLADSDGGCASSYLEIIVRFGRCLVLDIFGPYLIGNVSAAGDPISSAP